MSNQENLLRAEAEAKLSGFKQPKPVRSAEVLLHELEVYQIELEMQNETLRQTQLALEESRDRYADLYDFAPVGYLTLDANSMIAEANLTSADLLGLTRKALLGERFSGFVAVEDRERWYRFFLDISRDDSLRRCELSFMRADLSVIFAQLECMHKVTAKGELTIRMAFIDITARRKADLALRASEAKLRGFYEVSPLGIVLTDMQGRYIEFNRTFTDICGYTEVELGKLDCRALTPNEYVVEEAQQLDTLQRTGRYGPYEKEYIRKDGRRVPVRLHGVLIKHSDAQQYIWSMVEDITVQQREHEQIEAVNHELRESRQLLETIVENIPVMIFLKRASDLRFNLVNRAGEQLLGYPRSMLLGKGDADMWPAQQAEHFIAADRLALTVSDIMELPEECITVASGETRYLHTWKIALRDETGSATHLLGISVDITERKQADRLLRESESKLSIIFDGALDGIALLDAETMRFNSGNPALCNMLGYRREEFSGMSVADIHRLADLSWVNEDIQRRLRGEIDINVDIPVLHRDGSVFYVDIKSTSVEIGGKAYLLSIFRDASQRRKVEQELREYQQLLRDLAVQGSASREAELKHIAREVHDELGQLLTALRMDISLLRIQFGAHDPILMPKIQNLLSLLDKAIACARDVTANLHPPVMDMGIVAAVSWLSQEFSSRMAIPCLFSCGDELIELDDARTLTIFRIVQESLTNITRYAQASHVEISLVKGGEAIRVKITDDGQGFDKNVLPLTQTYGLLGMKERALALDGKVEISSSPGAGTVVFVEIPLLEIHPGRRVND